MNLAQGPLGILFKRATILAALILFSVIKAGIALQTLPEGQSPLNLMLAPLAYTAIAWYAWRRKAMAHWAITLLLIINGTGSMLNAFGGTLAPDALNLPSILLNTVLGGYFLLAGYAMLMDRPPRT